MLICRSINHHLAFIFGLVVLVHSVYSIDSDTPVGPALQMSNKERHELKEEAREMFYHAYHAYMDNAYPADELMPLSCTGRHRGVGESLSGVTDEVLGNFTMTLVDTLDTLVILGDLDEFERAVKLVIDVVQFDSDIVVSVFETNIRMVGGLLSSHILAEHIQKEGNYMPWYRGELLGMAKDLGYRLLPAFNTTTGIPHSRVNLRHGMRDFQDSSETCTACGGTFLLEFAALSRLSGVPIFEVKAHAAMDALWRFRNPGSDIMGTVLNVHSGDWMQLDDAGVGAGIDSYYEYCLKSFVLLGDRKYLQRFNRHYQAIMKNMTDGPLTFIDGLVAFWPGLQVLYGDLKSAVQMHEALYQVTLNNTFISEAFTFDFQIYDFKYLLRPDFIESTYFLYKATGDHYYLHVAKKALQALQKHTRVPCGFAAIYDLRTGKHQDRMESFVLSETFKYLFLMFADPTELVLDLDKFIFTTDAHLLPLSLGQLTNATTDLYNPDDVPDLDYLRSCPSPTKLFPESVRRPIRDLVAGVFPRAPHTKHLSAVEFQATNSEHVRSVKEMGIELLELTEGKVQLVHNVHNAKTPQDAEKGLLFMQEVSDLFKQPSSEVQEDYFWKPEHSFVKISSVHLGQNKPASDSTYTAAQAVFFRKPDNSLEILAAGPSLFSRVLVNEEVVRQQIVNANPLVSCTDLINEDDVDDRILVVHRGQCSFAEKARRAQAAGAVAVIVFDNNKTSSMDGQILFTMSGDGTDDVTIPVVFLYGTEAAVLEGAMETSPHLEVSIMQLAGLQELLRLEALAKEQTSKGP